MSYSIEEYDGLRYDGLKFIQVGAPSKYLLPNFQMPLSRLGWSQASGFVI